MAGRDPLQQEKHRTWSAQRLYRPYVRWALVIGLSLGFSTGTAMFWLPALGIPVGQVWVTHTQAHGVAQLFGWAGLFVMGVAYHVVPRFRNGLISFPWSQRIVLALILLGIGLRFVGQTAPALEFRSLLLMASGGSLALGICLFAAVVGHALWQGTAPHGPPEAWLWMGLLWAVAAVGLHLAAVVQMASEDLVAAPPFLSGAFVQAALVGFVGNFIFGTSLRAIPAFMSLPPLHQGRGWLALLALNGGVALTIAGWLLGPAPRVMVIAALLELLGFVAFVAAMRLYSRRPDRKAYTLGAYGRYEWYLRAAYGWLLVAGALQTWNAVAYLWPAAGPPINLAAPALHTLALGFVTMSIMGMAVRMLPIFEGAVVPLHGLMDGAFALLNAAVLLRLAYGTIPFPAAWVGLALSGSLATLALVCFSVVVWRTLHPSSRQKYAEMARNFGRQQLVFAQRQRGSSQTPPST
jgi:hypothetical protein